MRNAIIEKTIDEVIAKSDLPEESKNAFCAYVKNMFEGNANEDDLRKVLELIDWDEEA